MNYAKHYAALIERGRRRYLWDCYYETHHIVPRCIGGGDEPENLVRLTPEEHYVAHQLLIKIHPRKGKLLFAAKAMTMEARTHGGHRSKNKLYGWIRRRLSAHMAAEKRKRRSGKRYGQRDIARMKEILALKAIYT